MLKYSINAKNAGNTEKTKKVENTEKAKNSDNNDSPEQWIVLKSGKRDKNGQKNACIPENT